MTAHKTWQCNSSSVAPDSDHPSPRTVQLQGCTGCKTSDRLWGLGSNGTESALKRPPLDLAVASTRLWLRTPAWGRLRKRKKSYAKEVMRLESNDRALVRTLQGSLPHRVATHRWPVVFWPTQSCCRSSAVFALLFGQADGRFQARP